MWCFLICVLVNGRVTLMSNKDFLIFEKSESWHNSILCIPQVSG